MGQRAGQTGQASTPRFLVVLARGSGDALLIETPDLSEDFSENDPVPTDQDVAAGKAVVGSARYRRMNGAGSPALP